MASPLLESSTGTTGNDELMGFLQQHRDELALSDSSALNNVNEKLRAGNFRLADLFKLDVANLQAALTNSGLGPLETGRLLAVLRGIPESFASQQAQTVQIVAISNEERDALSDIQTETAKIDDFVTQIVAREAKVAGSCTECETAIERNCHDIVANVNKRKDELLALVRPFLNMCAKTHFRMHDRSRAWRSANGPTCRRRRRI